MNHAVAVCALKLFSSAVQRTRRGLVAVMAGLAGIVASSSAQALLGIDSPWCMGDGGGTFLCTRGEDRVKAVTADAELDYLQFVEREFTASTIRFARPVAGLPAEAQTWHGSGGGLSLYRREMNNDRQRILEAAEDWFKRFCKAKGGGTYLYPINDTADVVNVRRLGCHAKPAGGQRQADLLLFGIEISPEDNYLSDNPKKPYVVLKHYADGATLQRRWGYPLPFKPGMQTNFGTVLEVRIPMAKVQEDFNGQAAERWVKLVDLRPL